MTSRPNSKSIDDAVVDIFDELLIELSVKQKLHPSEEIGREDRMGFYNTSKIYDYIHPYHAFCLLCEQHIYTRSFADDVNSFFQKHLNTSFHRQQRAASPWPEDSPILSWENIPFTGKCHVCNLSGLKSFVINTNLCIKKIMRQHACVASRDQRETNEKFLWKLNLLKRYCGLKLFQEKFIKTLNNKQVCLLCGVKLPWPRDKIVCHLKSDAHYEKFCVFLWVNFSFVPKDILNGFHLEGITRWLMAYTPPIVPDFVDFRYKENCLRDSNNTDNPYWEDEHSLSFSPTNVEQLLRDINSDFVYGNECLLCDTHLMPGHFVSPQHCSKAACVNESSFAPGKYAMYSQNRMNRLHPFTNIINHYKRLVKNLEKGSASTDGESPKDFPPGASAEGKFFSALFAKKLALVEEGLTDIDDENVFCQVCQMFVKRRDEKDHLKNKLHKGEMGKWNELKGSMSNTRFWEPFKEVNSTWVCLLCGVVINLATVFSHVKGAGHLKRLKMYSSLNFRIPISSAFTFQEDWSCCCTVCGVVVSPNSSLFLQKEIFERIKCHWPCFKANKASKELPSAVAVNTGTGETMLVPYVDLTAKERNFGGGAQVDFHRVGETLENIMNVFERGIMAKVIDRSLCIIHCVNTSVCFAGDGSAKPILEMQPSLRKDSLLTLKQPPEDASASENENEDEDEDTELDAEGNEKKGKVQDKGADDKSEEKSGKDGTRKNAEFEKKLEAIIIKGLPKRKMKYEMIRAHFQKFGRVQFIKFDSKAVIVFFAEKGVAAAAAREAKVILQNPKIIVTVSERAINEKSARAAAEKPLTLDKEVVDLLRDPQKLMEFLLALISQAEKASSSPVEVKREEMVCNMIIKSVWGTYPTCRCYPFGSRLAGLTLDNSDLDVFLDCGGMYEGFKFTTSYNEKKLVRTVAGALRKRREVSDIIVVDSARVPIVTFFHKPTQMHCDISFKNGISIQNSLLIKFLVSLDWRVKPLILFMKYWAKLNGLHGPPFFSSYALSMLVINYLEQLEHPILPTIESLQTSKSGGRMTIGGWDCSFNTNTTMLPRTDNKDPLPILLEGLFDFYATFDFARNVVFPLTGKALPRDAFSVAGKDKLPMCFKRHIINIPFPLENLVCEKFPICILDPFDLSHVLTKSFTPQGVMQFVNLCEASKKHLRAGMTASEPQE